MRVCLPSVAVLLACAACGPAKTFDVRAVDELTLRQSKTEEYRGALGEPKSRHVVMTGDGRFERLEYAMIEDEFGGICMRMVILEFRNDVFNGYLSGSSCGEDETQANTVAAEQLRARIGFATVDDVVALLGKPSGNAICPTDISAFKVMCRDASQALAWLGLGSRGFAGGGAMHTKIVVVAFDANGRVGDVRVEERMSS